MNVAALLLAAGAGSRFGGCKQLAPVNGKPMLLHSLNSLSQVFGENLLVVLGAHANDIQPVVKSTGVNMTINQHWNRGLGSSIAHGVSTLTQQKKWGGILIALADQLLLTHKDYQLLLNRFDGRCIVATNYSDQVGVPAIFPPILFDELTIISGDRGAKSILTKMSQELVAVTLPAAATDIDTIEDLRSL